MSIDNGQNINSETSKAETPVLPLTRRQAMRIISIIAVGVPLAACGGSNSGKKNSPEGTGGGQEVDDQDYGAEMDLLTDIIREARVVKEGRARINPARDAFTRVDFGIAWQNNGLGSLIGTKRILINVYKEVDGVEVKNTIKIEDGEQIVVEDIDFTDDNQRVTFRVPKGFELIDTPWENHFKEVGDQADSRVEIAILTEEKSKNPVPNNNQQGKIS